MNAGVQEALLALLGTLAGSLVTWLIARRKASGRVDTTDASRLWDANDSFRQSLLAEAQRLRDAFAEVQRDLLDSFKDSVELRAAIDDAKKENAELRLENHALRNRVMASEWDEKLGGARRLGGDDEP